MIDFLTLLACALIRLLRSRAELSNVDRLVFAGLSVPKIRFCNNDDEVRRGPTQMRCGTLASKFATPQSLVDFCKSSPEANKTDGDCDLDEIRRLGVKEGLQIDVVHQVGPDANNFSSLFSVRVVKRD